MTEPTPLPPTDKLARDMNDQEKRAFLEACRKLDAAPKPPPVETPKHARDLSESERAEWLAAHRRKFQ
jgi:hypothetical protein